MIDYKTTLMVYVAGSYRSKSKFYLKRLIDVFFNIKRARKYSVKVWKSGKFALCPHSNSAFFDFLGVDDDIILPGCIKMMLACDEIHVLPGAKESSGTQKEVKLAHKNGLSVYYVDAVGYPHLVKDPNPTKIRSKRKSRSQTEFAETLIK